MMGSLDSARWLFKSLFRCTATVRRACSTTLASVGMYDASVGSTEAVHLNCNHRPQWRLKAASRGQSDEVVMVVVEQTGIETGISVTRGEDARIALERLLG
jgi:hypothetical protein